MAETITIAFWTILCINAMMFMGQISLLGVNPSGTEYMTCQGNLIGQLETSGCTVPGQYILNDSNPSGVLPSGQTAVDPNTGFQYTDSFTGIKGFFMNTLGLGYVVQVLSAPYNFLQALGLPQAYRFIIGSLWYAFTLFLIVGYFFGRST